MFDFSKFPKGILNWLKPLQTTEGSPVEVVGLMPSGAYPVLVSIDGDFDPIKMDGDGDTDTGDYKIENAGQRTFFAVLKRDGDGDFYFDEEAYETEDDARAVDGMVTVQAVTYGAEIAEKEDAESEIDTISLNGRQIKVGDSVRAYRRNFGTRSCAVLKIRNDVRKSLFIDPRDGNSPYWALNKNIS